jgi:hypothetical protein
LLFALSCLWLKEQRKENYESIRRDGRMMRVQAGTLTLCFFCQPYFFFLLLAALVHNRLLKPENNQNDKFSFSALFTFLNGNETVFQTCCLLWYPLIGNVFMHLFRQFIALVG